MNPALLNVILAETPAVIALIKSAFTKANPNAPVPTDTEVIAGWLAAAAASLAKDDAILAAHARLSGGGTVPA